MTALPKRNFFDWFIKRPRISGLAVTALLMIVVLIISFQRYQMVRSNEQREMYNLMDVVHHNLEQTIRSCYTSSLSLALSINDKGEPEHFEEVAADILQSNSVIDALELVPDGVIKYVYPKTGNEQAIGLDILNSPIHSQEAKRSLREGRMYFAGPMHLLQGGVGVVGRLPVYRSGRFWGFSAVVIRMETLYRVSGIHSIDQTRYYFQLVKKNPTTGKKELFLPEEGDYSKKYHVSKTIPDGGWELVLVARSRYAYLWTIVPTMLFGMGLALLFGFVIQLLLNKPAEAVKESEARFESLFNDSPVALWEEDFSEVKKYLKKLGLVGMDPERVANFLNERPDVVRKCLSLVTIINVNHECLKLHHPKSRESLLSKSLNSLIDSQNYSDIIQQLIAVATNELQITMDTGMTDGSGKYRDLFLQWSVMRGYEETLGRVIVSTEDITNRKAAEKLAFASQQRIESLVNTIDGVVWESNFANDDITFVNAKAEEITGYPAEQWLHEPNFWTNHIYPEDREAAIQLYSENVYRRKHFSFEYRFVKQDGSLIWVKDYVNVISEEDQPASVRGIMIDITKTKEAEERLNESLKLVTEQNKRLQNFSYIVSHNLRSHTSNIQSIAALMETIDSEHERRQMVEMLRKVSASLNETMTNLNEVVNIQTNISLVCEMLDLRYYIDSTLTILSEQLSLRKAHINVDVPADARIMFNAAYLESILLNLISNAVRYSSPDKIPEITVRWSEENGHKLLEIKDNGIGIDLAKNGDKIFGMYKTFSNNPDSRGIGLFITKNQIEAMGGSIIVESKPGKGTTFRIFFK